MLEKGQLKDKFPDKKVINEQSLMGKEVFLTRFTQLVSKALDDWEQSKAVEEKDG